VPDRKAPRVHGGERETVLALLQYQRDSLAHKVSGVSDEAARRSPVASGTTLLWLVKHMAHAESLWILRRFAGQDIELPDEAVSPGDAVASAVEAYRTTWGRIDAVVAATPNLDESCRAVDGGELLSLRWVLLHLLEETARHAGHADILRELIDGHTGR
jgi:uncharacterized damage-inducible protein DinB